MDKKKQEKVLNRIKAKKIVWNLWEKIVNTKMYKIDTDIDDSILEDVLLDYIGLVNKFHLKGRKESYTEDTPRNEIIKDFLSIQNLWLVEDGIETLWLKYQDLWKIVDLQAND